MLVFTSLSGNDYLVYWQRFEESSHGAWCLKELETGSTSLFGTGDGIKSCIKRLTGREFDVLLIELV